jgi:hypothetical protein
MVHGTRPIVHSFCSKALDLILSSCVFLCPRPKKISSVQRRNSSLTWYHSPNLRAHRHELTVSQARKQKAEKYKDVGDPIELPGVPLDIEIRGNYAWIAGSDHAARKVDLQVYEFTLHALSGCDADVGVTATGIRREKRCELTRAILDQ